MKIDALNELGHEGLNKVLQIHVYDSNIKFHKLHNIIPGIILWYLSKTWYRYYSLSRILDDTKSKDLYLRFIIVITQHKRALLNWLCQQFCPALPLIAIGVEFKRN